MLQILQRSQIVQQSVSLLQAIIVISLLMDLLSIVAGPSKVSLEKYKFYPFLSDHIHLLACISKTEILYEHV